MLLMKMKRRFGKENTIETIGLRSLLNALPKQQRLVPYAWCSLPFEAFFHFISTCLPLSFLSILVDISYPALLLYETNYVFLLRSEQQDRVSLHPSRGLCWGCMSHLISNGLYAADSKDCTIDWSIWLARDAVILTSRLVRLRSPNSASENVSVAHCSALTENIISTLNCLFIVEIGNMQKDSKKSCDFHRRICVWKTAPS